MSVSPPAERVPVITWVTPKGRQDVLFYVPVQTTTLPKNSQWTYGDPYRPDPGKYPDHKLVHVSETDDKGWSRWYYAAVREAQDDYNFEYASADLGGRRFPTVERRYVNLRSAFSPVTPGAGAAMPVTPGTLFQGQGYVLMGRTEERIGDERLDSLFVVERLTYVRKSTVVSIGTDPLNGEELYKATDFYYATEANVAGTGLTAAELFAAPGNAYWGLQSTGFQRSGQQVSADWYVIDNERIIGGTFAGGQLQVAQFPTSQNYSWPPVLNAISFEIYEKREGGEEIYPRIKFLPEGFNGPCRAQVTLTWKSTPFSSLTPVEQMQPARIYYSCPYFTLNVPECLHDSLNVVCDIGTADPFYRPHGGSSLNFPATEPTEWPDSIIAYSDQKQFRGGFLKEEMVIYKPGT